MAESSTGADVGFPPFNSDRDVLLDEYYISPDIQDIPPSASASSTMQSQTESAQCQSRTGLTEEQKQELLNEINKADTPEQMKSLIQKCRSLGSDLDIDRLVRFAVYGSKLPIVEYLVEEENADLTRRDIFDRSVIFYVLYPKSELWEYLSKRGCFAIEHLNYLDKKKWSPLHYAARDANEKYIKYLLTIGANAEIRNGDDKMPIEMIDTDRFGGKSSMLLLAFWTLRQLYPHLTNAHLYHFRGISETKQLDILNPGFRLFKGTGIRWCHIPWTNGIIVFAALRQLQQGNSFYTEDVYRSWFQGATPVLSNPKLNCRKPYYESHYGQFRIVFPCLVLRTKSNHTQSREETLVLKSKMLGGLAQNVVQVEQTLDETYYSALSKEALEHRNGDQVVYREYKETFDGIPIDDRDRPILVVSQLWLWRSDNCIVTAYTEEGPCLQPIPESTFHEDFKNVIKEFSPIWGPGFNDYYYTALRAMRIITHRLSKFGKSQAGGKFPSPLDIFETSVVRILSDAEAYTDPTQKSLPEDIEKERDFMHRIADVREELVMIQEILDQQKEILQAFIQDFENHEFGSMLDSSDEQDIKGARILWEQWKLPAKDVDIFTKRLSKINKDAERIENLIQNQLNMKRTYASIRDTRTGLILSAAVIGFTVITIIFAPLAFMTSLFALPLEGLLKNQYQSDGGNGRDPTPAYTTRYVVTWFVVAEVVSLVVTILFVMLCLWYFDVIKNFSVMRENHSNKTKVADDWKHPKHKSSKVDNTTRSVGEKKSGSDQENAGMRRRITKLWNHQKKGESSMV